MRIATAHLLRTTALAVGLSLLAPVAVPLAQATPATPAIEAKQAEANAAQSTLEAMNATLEVQVEEYNAISEALDQTREQIRVTREELQRAERDLGEARKTLADRAASIYKDGGSGALDVFLGARTFDDFVVRLDLAVRINRSDATMVASVKDAKARVEQAALALDQRQAEQVALQTESGIRAAQIESDIQKQGAFVADLNDEVRSLIAAEEERQRLLAEERARQAAAAAAARNASAATGGRAAADPSTLGSGHSEVVAIALQYLGVPYKWGGSSPSGFDCSGLTQYVYRQVGVVLPRTSQSQYRAGQHIAPDRLDLLEPGDLVFFGRDGDGNKVHHVGMYVGNGNFIHAPNTGAVVRVDSLTSRISRSGDYVGASRF